MKLKTTLLSLYYSVKKFDQVYEYLIYVQGNQDYEIKKIKPSTSG